MPISSVNVAGSIYYCTKIENKEIIYRKKIARRLRTQYVEGIYRPNYSGRPLNTLNIIFRSFNDSSSAKLS